MTDQAIHASTDPSATAPAAAPPAAPSGAPSETPRRVRRGPSMRPKLLLMAADAFAVLTFTTCAAVLVDAWPAAYASASSGHRRSNPSARRCQRRPVAVSWRVAWASQADG